MKKIEEKKIENRRSDEKLAKTLREWGMSKAKMVEQSTAKIDSKAIMAKSARNYHQQFTKTVRKYKTPYFDISKRRIGSNVNYESDSSANGDQSRQKKVVISPPGMEKSATQQTLMDFPKITKRKMHQPKIHDFSTDLSQLNANQLDEDGKPHFKVDFDDNKFVSFSPTKKNLTKLREYYDNHLWAHMHDFRQDGKTKINNIRKKYRNLLSPQAQINGSLEPSSRNTLRQNSVHQRTFRNTMHAFGRDLHSPSLLTSPSPPIIFAKREHNDQFRYDQLKEINSLKDR